MHEEKGNVKLFTSTDHKGMYRIAFKHQTTNEVYSMQDLKDLRDLITEELGEECEHRGSENGICNGCGKEVYPQPLTEGEGETGYNFETNSVRIGMLRQWLNEDRIDSPKKMVTNEQLEYWLQAPIKEHVDPRLYEEPQQESNKEEVGKGCYIDKLGQLVHDIPHTCNGLYEVSGWAGGSPQEPSKKPSERITKLFDIETNTKAKLSQSEIWISSIIQYLDELHNQGKI